MTFKVLGICGSLRKGSFNAMALRAAVGLAPEGMEIEVADIGSIPMYNDDVRNAGEPDEVARLKAKISAADAVLLVSPEYNFSVPGVLKNTLDWVSRPPAPPFENKPVAIMGVSPGMVGTARMQYHLRQVLVFMNSFTLNKPEIFIGQAASKFNADGELIDKATADIMTQQLLALKQLAERVSPR